MPIQRQAQIACAPVFTGTIAEGGGCFFGEECVSKDCQPGACAGACCRGTCGPLATSIPVGGDCSMTTSDHQCVSASFCLPEGASGALICVAWPNVAGAACTSQIGCDVTLYCDADPTTGVGTCKRGTATGGACNPALPGSCDRNIDVCSGTTSVCVAPMPVGGACDPNDAALPCVGYATCDATTSTCRGLARLDEACDPTTLFLPDRACLRRRDLDLRAANAPQRCGLHLTRTSPT